MDITQTSSEGLAREFKIVVGASELDDRLMSRLEEIKDQVQIKGFRPGKVPVTHLKRIHGKSVMTEVVQEIVTNSTDETLTKHEIKAAQQPRIELPEADVLEPVFEGKADFEFTIALEVMPDFEKTDLGAIELEKEVIEVGDADIDERLEMMAEGSVSYKARGAAAKAVDKDQVTIDFVGTIDGEEFEGGKGDDAPLVLGSGSFIPGFEEQLVGTKKGDDLNVNVTFPDDYQAEQFAGKDAVFKVVVKEVSEPETPQINDEFAAQVGMTDLAALKEAIKSMIAEEFGGHSRTKLKRKLLDALDVIHTGVELPQGMVGDEFDQIWEQVQAAPKDEDDEDLSEEEERAEYRTIAERRVRLGLVLAEIGTDNNIQVTQEELSRGIAEQARQMPGQEQMVYNFYQENPQALEQMRAPLFEDKVVDFIFEMGKISEKVVSKDELMADPDEAPAKKKKAAPKKKAATKKKAAPKKKAAAKKTAEKKTTTKKKAAKKTTKKAAKKDE
jgi:trigger factor